MRSWIAAFAAAALFTVPAFAQEAPAPEEAVPEASEQAASEAAADAAAEAGEEAPASAAETKSEAARASHTVVLGPVGYDDAGQPGRIHEVAKGDTLWDVSDAYLGTPWVWPAIWTDNDEIQNPHLIMPGDKLWITPREMRRVGDAEAQRMLANGGVPAALADGLEMGAPEVFHFSPAETAGYVTTAAFESAGMIMDSAIERTWLADHDEVVINYGRDEIGEGQQLEIFRRGESVKHPVTGRPIGWMIEVMGWLEVTRVDDEASVAEIRMSAGEVRRGDLVRPRPISEMDIPVLDTPDVLGLIVHTPPGRLEVGSNDVVYLNRGSADGLGAGSPLEVFRPMTVGIDRVGPFDRKLPDRVVGKMIVVSTEPETSTALVTHSSEDLARGDEFRGSDSLR